MASSSAASYDGVRQVNAFYHSVIEEVAASLQTLFEDEKEEETKRLKKHLEKRLKEQRAKVDKSAKGKKGPTGAKGKACAADGAEVTAGATTSTAALKGNKAEVKHLETLLKKPASKLFEPEALIADFRHLWLQKLRAKRSSGTKSAGATAKETTTVVGDSAGSGTSATTDGATAPGSVSAKTTSDANSRAATLATSANESNFGFKNTRSKSRNPRQTDGADSSAEEGEDEDDYDDDDGMDAFAPELCDDDDLSDDPDSLFDCDDVILCKFVEVSREKGGRWRIKLKEGVANIHSQDLIFKECSSDLLDFY